MKQFVIPSVFTAVDKVSEVVTRMGKNVAGFANTAQEKAVEFNKRFEKIGKSARSVAVTTGVAAAALGAPLIIAANDAIKFEDRQADVAKTTGLSGKALQQYGDEILKLSTNTRTGIEDLQKIAEIGGQLGVPTSGLLAFTKASNEFAVALGSDYGGTEQAITQVGKINKLFSDTKNLNIADSITRTGSAINELGNVGAGTSANINDFVLRMGALPDAIKPTFTSTVALGTYLEELGINSEIAAGGLTRVLLDAGKQLPKFAAQMGLTAAQAKTLLTQDPTAFVNKLATSFNGLKPDQLAKKMKQLGIDSQESIKVLGALGANTARLAELQGISNKAFAEGISLTNEAGKKENTTAGQLEQLTNNIKVFSITVGTQLLPILTAVIRRVVPVVNSVVAWAKEHPGLTKAIVLSVAALAAFLAVTSAVSGTIAAISAAGPALVTMGGILANYIVPALQVGWAVLVSILEIVAGALGVGVGALGAAIAVVVGIVISLYNHWDMVVNAFTNGGILEGLKAIGAMLLDVVLYPLQKILEVAASIPGVGKFAAAGAAAIEGMRADMGLTEPVNPRAEQQKAMSETITNSTTTKNVKVEFSNLPAGTRVSGDGLPDITPAVTPTYN